MRPVNSQVRDQVQYQVWGQVQYQVEDQVWNQVLVQVWGQVSVQVRVDRKSTRLNSSHSQQSRMPSSA